MSNYKPSQPAENVPNNSITAIEILVLALVVATQKLATQRRQSQLRVIQECFETALGLGNQMGANGRTNMSLSLQAMASQFLQSILEGIS
jgi:hypothetical protein